MGERAHQTVEVVDFDDRIAEGLAILRTLYERVQAGAITGLMVIAERPTGAYTATDFTMTGSGNVAERIGRLRLLRAELDDMEAAILASAKEVLE